MSVTTDYTFISKMPNNLMKFRNDKTFCDVILRSGLREVYAHRIILAMLSEYFTVLFKYEGSFEKPAIDFDVDMISGECLENIVDYAYTGKIYLCEENAYDMLLAADYFDIRFIKTECEEFLHELHIETESIHLETLPRIIWIACHFNLTTILEPICKFVSKHFAEITESNILLALSPHSLLTLLQEKDLTVLYNGIPADDVEFELFKLVVSFIKGNDLTDHDIIIKLIKMIKLSEITHEQLSSVVESSGCIREKETISRVFNSLLIDEEEAVPERKYSRGWKNVGVGGIELNETPTIELEDRIRKIKIFTCTGIPCANTRRKNIFNLPSVDYEEFLSVKGLYLTYKSGKIVTKGDTSEEPVLPFDKVDSQEFTLGDNEVIVKILINKTSGMLKTIRFLTNLGNAIGTMGENCSYLHTFSPNGECGYFHSIGEDSAIDSLKFLWVEYNHPKLREIASMTMQSGGNNVFVKIGDLEDYGLHFANDDDDSSLYTSDSDYLLTVYIIINCT